MRGAVMDKGWPVRPPHSAVLPFRARLTDRGEYSGAHHSGLRRHKELVHGYHRNVHSEAAMAEVEMFSDWRWGIRGSKAVTRCWVFVRCHRSSLVMGCGDVVERKPVRENRGVVDTGKDPSVPVWRDTHGLVGENNKTKIQGSG